ERTVVDANALALGELDLERVSLDPRLLEDLLGLALFERGRAVAGAHEAGDTRRVAHDVPGIVAHHHLDQDVAGEDLLVNGLPLAVLDLDLLLHGYEHLE